MNTEAQSKIANALSGFTTLATKEYVTGSGTVAGSYIPSGFYSDYPWNPTKHVHHCTFDSDKEAQLKAIKAIIKLKIDDEDKVEAIGAILK